MSNVFDSVNHYFSGQGVVMLGSRDASGLPAGLRPLGNVSSLKIGLSTSVLEHKNSQDGQRGTDSRLQTEVKVDLTMTLDNWISKNLALALRGDSSTKAAGDVASESVNGYYGLVTPLANINVSTVSLTGASAGPLTAYTNSSTPYEYQLNPDAGSFMLNDPSVSGISTAKAGYTPTVFAVGATSVITTPVPSGTSIGDRVVCVGFTGADAALLNGVVTTISALGTGTITLPIVTTAKTITVGATSRVVFLDRAEPVTAAYSYAAQSVVNAMTQPLKENWLRFEGLNTVETSESVIVDVFRFSNDPLKELSLLDDTYMSFEVEGSILRDQLAINRLGGSGFFSIKKIT